MDSSSAPYGPTTRMVRRVSLVYFVLPATARTENDCRPTAANASYDGKSPRRMSCKASAIRSPDVPCLSERRIVASIMRLTVITGKDLDTRLRHDHIAGP